MACQTFANYLDIMLLFFCLDFNVEILPGLYLYCGLLKIKARDSVPAPYRPGDMQLSQHDATIYNPYKKLVGASIYTLPAVGKLI